MLQGEHCRTAIGGWGGGGGIFVIPPAVDFDHGACEVALQVEESNALSRLVENLE